MSGICGVVRLDGGDPDLSPVLEALKRRGPDGSRIWQDGPVALGHTLLATTPEALVEQLPLTDPDSGCTITADARIDNRDELMLALGLVRETRVIGDGELILRAYLEWGEDCPKHLLGDFAFAIWDSAKERLFCARDHMGMRQLIYHHAPGKLFAFATETEALLAHPSVPQRINEARIADFLDDLEGVDLTSTFFENVVRLPPAHAIVLGAAGLSLRRYWRLEAGPELRLDSDQAYADAFLAVFTEAVRCRLRSAGPVGSTLSGGLDSNSVVAVASRLVADQGLGGLATFSVTGPEPESCVETAHIRIGTANENLDAVVINYADLGDLGDDLILATLNSAEPFDGHMTMIRAIYLTAHRAGFKVLLDGVAADVVTSPGNRVAELLRRGRLWNAFSEAKAQRAFLGPAWTTPNIFFAAVWAALVPRPLRSARRDLIGWYADCRAGWGLMRITPSLVRRANLRERRVRFRRHAGSGVPVGASHRAKVIRHPHLVVGRERYDRVAASCAIEPRDPFLDLRVISFCLSLPPSQLQSEGWSKVILRRAMKTLVPAQILVRRGTEHLGWATTLALTPWNDERLAVDMSRIGPYVRAKSVRTTRNTAFDEMDTPALFELRLLSAWLARNHSR